MSLDDTFTIKLLNASLSTESSVRFLCSSHANWVCFREAHKCIPQDMSMSSTTEFCEGGGNRAHMHMYKEKEDKDRTTKKPRKRKLCTV